MFHRCCFSAKLLAAEDTRVSCSDEVGSFFYLALEIKKLLVINYKV